MLGAAAALAAGPLTLSTDARYSLAWGAELARGDAPDIEAPSLPTPHPLPIALGALLEPLGPRGATAAYAFLTALAVPLLVAAAFLLGRALGGALAGGAAAVLVLTRPRLDFFAAHGFIDIPFAGLVLLAAAVAVRDLRGRAVPALALLAAAGLLRPEAWGISALYLAWLALERRAPPRPLVVALAAAAPAIWTGFDLALTGDALHSLASTQENADTLRRATGLDDVVPEGADGLHDLVGLPAAAAGALAAAWALAAGPAEARGRFALVAVLAAAGLLGFAALGPLDLPLNDRYVLVPALALLLLGAGATGHVRRSAIAAGAAAVAIVPAAVALPGDLDETREMVRLAGRKSAGDRDLARLAERPSVRAEVARCSYVVASGSGRAAVAALLERDPADVPIARRPLPRPGTAAFSTADSLPPGTSRMTREGAWAFVSRC